MVSLRDLLQAEVDEKDDEIKLMHDYIHYVPPPDSEELATLAGKLGELFARHAQAGGGSRLYRAELHWGRP